MKRVLLLLLMVAGAGCAAGGKLKPPKKLDWQGCYVDGGSKCCKDPASADEAEIFKCSAE